MQLLATKFYNHDIFSDKFIQYVNDKEKIKSDENYMTIIIGPNGTGKSTLLKEISRMFRDTYARQIGPVEKKVLDYKYGFSVQLLQNKYDVYLDDSGKRQYRINNAKCLLDEWDFPAAVIAVSSMPTDKFIFSKNDDNSIYKYAGIRSSNSSTGTKTIIKNIIQTISTSTYDKIKQIIPVLELLNFKQELSVYYEAKSISTFNSLNTIDDLDAYFNNLRERRKTLAYSISTYNKLDDIQKNEILRFIDKKMFHKDIIFNLINKKDYKEFINFYHVLNLLTSLDLVKTPEILFNKNDSYNSNNDISSGEYNLIFQFIRIFLLIENDSLLLIDEPEISLHPNWQIQYLTLLEKCLASYKGIHTIIATHSHLLLTGLNPNYSNVITIRRDLSFENLEYSVSGWSPENILYRVFQLTSVRNHYFEIDIRRIIHFIETREDDIYEIQSIISRLEKFILSKEDPLNGIINQAKDYLK